MPAIVDRRDFIEFVWRGLGPALGTQNQDLIDLFLIATLVKSDRFDHIVEVGRGGGTVTSVVCEFKSPDAKFISICPQTTFLKESLPILESRWGLTCDHNTRIVESDLQEFPLLRNVRDAQSILLLFDADHTASFARYYLNNIVASLRHKSLLIGVHDMYTPAIQSLIRPNQWDDPRGPYQVDGLACRWNEILPVMEFISQENLEYQQTGQLMRRILLESEGNEYLNEISTVRVPPYSDLWPFEGAAGTWLFIDPGPSQPVRRPSSLVTAYMREALTTTVRRCVGLPKRLARRLLGRVMAARGYAMGGFRRVMSMLSHVKRMFGRGLRPDKDAA